jgi:Ca2+-binding RTX toxin-like protein
MSGTSAFLNDGTAGGGIFIFLYPASLVFSEVERLVVTGSGYFGRAQDGSYFPGGWSTGDTIDELHVVSTRGQARITVSSGGGDDKVYLGDVGSGSGVNAGSGNDLIDLTAVRSFGAFANGGEGDDILLGSPGNDSLDGGPGADNMAGGAGNDGYVVDDVADVVTESPDAGIDVVYTALAVYTLGPNLEDLTVNYFAGVPHDFTLNAGDNRVTGESGPDFLRLQQGGVDHVFGLNGNDVFYFGAAMTTADSADGGGGTDQIALQGDYSGANALTFGAGVVSVENLALLPGSDTRFGDPGTNFYDYVIATLDVNLAAGVQMVIDANRLRVGEDFTFNGSAESDGSFFVYGGGGTDNLTGGAKNDVFLFGAQCQWGASDVLTGGAGIDQLALRGDYTIAFGAGQLIGIEQIALVSAFDTRFGALGDAYDYNLTMDDANVAAGIQMTVDAALLRPGESLTFNGGAETDGSFRIFGGQGNDLIVGGQNGDVIAGGAGRDMLFGNAGSDVFRYNAAADSTAASQDIVRDFALGDLLDLSRIDADSAAAGNQAFSFIGTAAFGHHSGELRVEEQRGSIWLVQGDTDGDAAADFELLLFIVDGHPPTSGDFIL